MYEVRKFIGNYHVVNSVTTEVLAVCVKEGISFQIRDALNNSAAPVPSPREVEAVALLRRVLGYKVGMDTTIDDVLKVDISDIWSKCHSVLAQPPCTSQGAVQEITANNTLETEKPQGGIAHE